MNIDGWITLGRLATIVIVVVTFIFPDAAIALLSIWTLVSLVLGVRYFIFVIRALTSAEIDE